MTSTINIKKKLKDALYFSLGLILLVVIYIIFQKSKNNALLFPSINDILKELINNFTSISFYQSLLYTLLELIIVITISFITSLILAVISYKLNQIYKILKPIMSILRSIPIIIIILIVMLYAKLKITPYIVSIMVLIPNIYIGIYQGLINMNKDLIDVYRINSNTTLKVIFKVYIPLTYGYSKTVFTNALSLALKILISSEYIVGSKYGIGNLIINSIRNIEYDKLFSYTIILLILTLILEFIPDLLSLLIRKVTYKITLKNIKSLNLKN